MKKKMVVLAMLMALVLSFTACGGILDMVGDSDASVNVNGTEIEFDDEDADVDADENVQLPDTDMDDEEIEETDEDEGVTKPEKEDKDKKDENVTVNTPSELSDDLYSFQMSIEGTVYQFPMWFSDFEALGWEYQGDTTESLTSYQYTVYEEWQKDGYSVYTDLANLTMNSVDYAGTSVCGITIDYYDMEECDWEIILPKGIQRGVSTKEDIINAYGDPSSDYDGELYYQMTYRYDSYQEIDLYVWKESGVLEEIELRNMIELEGGDNSVDPTVPDAVKNYKAPTELGDDLYVYNIELEGELYSLPCPVSVFLENGFEIKESGTDMEIAADSYGWLELTYNNQSYRCIVDNYADYATIVENCFISTMESSEYDPDFDLVIPCNIKRGDTEASLLDAIKDFNYEVDSETSDTFTYYSIYAPGDEYGPSFDITVKEGVIIIIEVSCD